MRIPARREIAMPLLKAIADEHEHPFAEVVEKLTTHFNLSNEDKARLAADNRHGLFYYEGQWVLHVLKKSGFVTSTRWGHFKISDLGSAILMQPSMLDFDKLARESGDDDLDESIQDYQLKSSPISIKEVSEKFASWLKSESGSKHIKSINKERDELRQIMQKLVTIDSHSGEFTDWVLYGFIPHHQTRNAKRITMFPAAHDIKGKLRERYNYSDKAFNKLANLLYSLLKGFQESPERLNELIQSFKSDAGHSKGFQSGMLSPLLFFINDSVR